MYYSKFAYIKMYLQCYFSLKCVRLLLFFC